MDNSHQHVDYETLTKFTAFCIDQLIIYSQMLDALSKALAIILDGPEMQQFLEVAETEIDEYADRLIEYDHGSLNSYEYAAVQIFLNSLYEGDEGELLIFNGKQFLNAHDLALMTVNDAASAWRKFREECRNDSRSATEKFWKNKLWERNILTSIELYLLMAMEHAKARQILMARPGLPD